VARIRTIKPDFWTNEKVLGIKPLTRLLFIGMWNFADDFGRMQFAPLGIKAKIFPTDELSVGDVRDMLNELCSADLITIYSAKDQEYIEITGWDHQKIDRRQPSKIPGPFDDGSVAFVEHSTNPADSSSSPAPVMEGKGREGNSEANASGAIAPRDYRAELFGRGLQSLASMTGKGPDACRSFVGKCLKATGDDAVTVLGLIEDAERNQVVDPSAWIAARLKGPIANGKPPSAIIQAADNLRAKLASFDGRAGRQDGLRGGEGAPPPRLLSNG
jgi:hypothetical protein